MRESASLPEMAKSHVQPSRAGQGLPSPLPAGPQGPFSTTNLGCHLPPWTPLLRWRSCLLWLVGSCWVLLGPRVPGSPHGHNHNHRGPRPDVRAQPSPVSRVPTIMTPVARHRRGGGGGGMAVAAEALVLVPAPSACPPSLSYCH